MLSALCRLSCPFGHRIPFLFVDTQNLVFESVKWMEWIFLTRHVISFSQDRTFFSFHFSSPVWNYMVRSLSLWRQRQRHRQGQTKRLCSKIWQSDISWITEHNQVRPGRLINTDPEFCLFFSMHAPHPSETVCGQCHRIFVLNFDEGF